MSAPKWAQNLLLDAMLWCEQQGQTIPNPSLSWRRRTGRYSSGHANYDTHTISVSAGHDRTDAKTVLLHELSHLLSPGHYGPRRSEHHTPAFWDAAWALYRWAGLPIRTTLARERTYRVGAAIAYRRSTKRD